ncbi:MAG: (2Fe-2S)-binding protein [Anaerolineales bacterium]|nr:(2Fe-2S)-binding protein [Anaerolineales bacterium]MCX7754533.1 (2Fe-2S)-binding protein [Anaerolineales bacterium]MDW8277234.1 (2Fe-2S)-binding protein [Anaerolineales bacterium]
MRPAATLWFGHVVYGVAGASIACFMVEQRVPDLSATHLRFLFGADGEMEHIAWIGRFFAASSSDSAAAHPDCIVLPERDALREYLRGQLIALFAPLIVLLSTYAAISQASLWALAADYLAYAFAAVGSLMGNSVLGIEESRAFAAVKSPLSTKRGFVAVEHLGQVEYLLERTSCCRYYQVKNGAYCHSCPGRPMKERIALVKQNMERYITGTT